MAELNYRLITNAEGVAEACGRLARAAEVGFDTETTSLSPFEGRLRLVQLAAAGEPVYVFDLDGFTGEGGDDDRRERARHSEALAPLRQLLAAARPVKIAHNCLAGDMLVSMADGTKVRLDELVGARTGGKVLCVDEGTGTLSTGDIVDWVDGGLRPWDDWLRVRMRGKGRLRLTKDHEILTERGRVRAENLLIGDKVLTSLPGLSQPQKDMLYGSLLGDGSLMIQAGAQARTPHFKVSHSLQQEGYVALKATALGDLVKLIKTEKVHYRGFSNNETGSHLISLTTKSDPRLFELYDDCLAGGKRTLTPGWLGNLTAPAIAAWYCDDGTLAGGSSASICVSALGAEGANLLVDFLRGKAFPAKLSTRADGQLYLKVVGTYGRGMSEGLKRFWASIAPYVPVSMQYKLPAAYRHLASDEYWSTPHANPRAFADVVVEILPLLNESSERGRYDGYRRGQRRGIRQYCLVIDTHHNFLAGGLAVSNCKFDAKWVRHHLGVELCGEFDSRAENKNEVERGGLFDTLLASQLISAGEQEDRHSLASVAERYLNQPVDKTQQVSDWGGRLSEAQLEYAARDAALMLPLRAKLVEALRANALTRTAQLEFECVVPLAELELTGVYLDEPCWRAKLKEIEKQRNELHEQLQDELAEEPAQQSLFGPQRADINLDSHVQLTRALTRVLPDPSRIPDSTRNWKLEPLALEFPVVRRILDYRTLQKTLKFGETLLESVNKRTGRIHSPFPQIGAPTGRMSCLAGDTLVSTDAGLKPIREVREGDRVKTSYGFKIVEEAWSNGRRRLYRVLLKDGHSIRATADHRFLTGRADTWKRLDELRPGDSLYVSLKASGLPGEAAPFPLNLSTPEARSRKPVRLPAGLSVELCELMGLITADGFLGRRHERPAKYRRWRAAPAAYDRVCIAFDRQDVDLIEKVVSDGLELFGQPFAHVKSRTCHLLQLASTKVAEFLAALGLSGDAHTKAVPEIILGAPPLYRAAFLRGLFEGDGNRSCNFIGLTSVNCRLLARVQLLLSEFGIHSVISRRSDTSGFSGAPRFDLKIRKKADVESFFQHVGFLSRRKNRRFGFVAAVTDGIPTPFVVPGAQLYREAVAAGTTTPSRAGVAPFAQFYKGAHIKGESVNKLINRFGPLPSLKPVVDYLDLQVRPSVIVSITTDAVEEVYDISVKDVHEFVADGIVVHNCTDPNIQQVPHAFDMRRCFRAPEGRKLIDADYSQIELRILADFTGDPGFVEAFRSGADLHRTTAAQVFGVRVEEVTKEQRDFAKRLNFGVVYGIGARRFALLTGLKESEAEDLLKRYFATYRGLDAWLREAGFKAVRERTAPRTVAGRLFRFNFDPEDRQAASLAQRNGKNSPIQGSSADIIKRALRLLHDRLKGTGARVVNVVHDEVVVECPAGEAEEFAKAVEEAMCAAGEEYVRAVPVRVEAAVTDEWVK